MRLRLGLLSVIAVFLASGAFFACGDMEAQEDTGSLDISAQMITLDPSGVAGVWVKFTSTDDPSRVYEWELIRRNFPDETSGTYAWGEYVGPIIVGEYQVDGWAKNSDGKTLFTADSIVEIELGPNGPLVLMFHEKVKDGEFTPPWIKSLSLDKDWEMDQWEELKITVRAAGGKGKLKLYGDQAPGVDPDDYGSFSANPVTLGNDGKGWIKWEPPQGGGDGIRTFILRVQDEKGNTARVLLAIHVGPNAGNATLLAKFNYAPTMKVTTDTYYEVGQTTITFQVKMWDDGGYNGTSADVDYAWSSDDCGGDFNTTVGGTESGTVTPGTTVYDFSYEIDGIDLPDHCYMTLTVEDYLGLSSSLKLKLHPAFPDTTPPVPPAPTD